MRNLCTAALIEAVRDRVKTVDLKQVDAVLMQPNWRHDTTGEPVPPWRKLTGKEGSQSGTGRPWPSHLSTRTGGAHEQGE